MKSYIIKFWKFLHLVLEDKELDRKDAIAEKALANYIKSRRG